MRNPDDNPYDEVERVEPAMRNGEDYDFRDDPKPSQTGGWKSLLIPLLIAVIVCFGMMTFWAMPQMVSRDDFNTNIGNIVTDMNGIKTSNESMVAVVETVNAMMADVQLAQESLASLLDTKASEGEIASLTNRVNDLQAQFSALPTSAELEALGVEIGTAIDGLQESLTELEAQIEDLQSGSGSQALTVQSFSPTAGVTDTQITIIGTGFVNVTNVTFGGVTAKSLVVDSPTQIRATVGGGATGYVCVYTSTGMVTSSDVFTYGTTIPPDTTEVTTTFSPSSFFVLPNTINIMVTNNTGHDIFGGQFSLTIQYLDATPSPTNMVGITATEISWRTGGSVSGVSLTLVGDSVGLFILNGQTKIITVDITPPPIGTQFRISAVTYTGWLE